MLWSLVCAVGLRDASWGAARRTTSVGGAAEAGVTAETLPGGRIAQVLHVGSYDQLEATYGRLTPWLAGQGLTPGPMMWETYLTEYDAAVPEATRTLIQWPLA